MLDALGASCGEPDESAIRGVYERGSAFIIDAVVEKTKLDLRAAGLPDSLGEICGKVARQSVPESLIRSVDEARAAAKEQARLLPQGVRPAADDLTVVEGKAALSSGFWKRLREHFSVEVPEAAIQIASDIIHIVNKLRSFSDLGYDVCSDFGGGESTLSQIVRASALPEDRPGVTEADAVIAVMRGRTRTPEEKRLILHREPPKAK